MTAVDSSSHHSHPGSQTLLHVAALLPVARARPNTGDERAGVKNQGGDRKRRSRYVVPCSKIHGGAVCKNTWW